MHLQVGQHFTDSFIDIVKHYAIMVVDFFQVLSLPFLTESPNCLQKDFVPETDLVLTHLFPEQCLRLSLYQNNNWLCTASFE